MNKYLPDGAGHGGISRRKLIKTAAAAAAGVAASPFILGSARAQSSMDISFWTYENPQARPWIASRIEAFKAENPHVNIDFQWFAFNDLGQRLNVGYATGTAPDGFVSQDWFMPSWLSRDVLAPMDVSQLGYDSVDAFRADHASAAVETVMRDGQVYGLPLFLYGFANYLNDNHFREAGLDPAADWPKTWTELGEVARDLSIKDGDRFTRQGFKFAMHSAQWSVIQYNPIFIQHGGQWFDEDGFSTINSPEGVEAMRVRASIAKEYNAEDPAETIATDPLPQMDWLQERASMFFCHPLPPAAVESQNTAMHEQGYYRPVQYPGVQAGEGFPTAYGFNFVVNKNTSDEKKEMLHRLYRFIMADLATGWESTGPFTPARTSGWVDDPRVQAFPYVDELIEARDRGVMLPRTTVYPELSDTVHRSIQAIMLNNADIKTTLDEAAAAIDRANGLRR